MVKYKNKTFYVTTPIYYPNAEPHIGSYFTTLIADILARWKRLEGYEVFFLTGTDEHGLKIYREAQKKQKDPKKFVDEMSAEFKKAWEALSLSYNRFIRTTDEDHEEVVKYVIQKLWEKGDLYKDAYKGWYCVDCEAYYTESDLVIRDEKKLCPVHEKELEWMEEETYFFKLSKYEDYVRSLIENQLIYPAPYKNEIINRLERGLKDISVTRLKERVPWGVTVPFDEKHVVYVWFDALLNYISGIGFLREKDKFKSFWPAIHIIGKDIMWFHTVIWPAILKAIELEPPEKVVIHSFWMIEGQKMSKSLGNIIYAKDLAKFGDSIRYFLIRQSSFDKDTNFSWQDFYRRYNDELIGIFGNLVRRIGVLAIRKLNRRVKRDKQELKELNINEIKRLIDDFQLNTVLVKIFDYLHEINKYLNTKEPWKKETPNREIYNAVEGTRLVTIALYPFLPNVCTKIAEAFRFRVDYFGHFGEVEEYIIKDAPIIFKKIQDEKGT